MIAKMVLLMLCTQGVFAMQPGGEFKKGKFVPDQVHWSKITPSMEQEMNEQELKKMVVAQVQLVKSHATDKKKHESESVQANQESSS